MNTEFIQISNTDVRKLLAAANGDAALLYLHICSGNPAEGAAAALGIPQTRALCAEATLRQMGLWPEERKQIPLGERPNYAERDVLSAMDSDGEFRMLYGEVQRQLGRNLNTEELKILLGFVRYLGLPLEVVSMLVVYCKDRARQKGSLRNPSLRAIEKEAYFWAENGIDTLEAAAAFIQNQNARNSRMGQLLKLLQIRGRALTPAEERYANAWLGMEIPDELIALAFEKTCINTGNLNWPYMNKILTSWHEAGYKTAQQVQKSDRKAAPKGATGQLGQAELDAIKKALQEV